MADPQRIYATATCALACATLVYAELAGQRHLRIAAKLFASAAFVGVGVVGFRAHPSAYGAIACGALVLGAIGDLCLLGASQRAFMAGLVAFLAGHITYCVAFAKLAPIGVAWLTISAAFRAFLCARTVHWVWPHAGKLRPAVVVYGLGMAAMNAGSIAASRTLPLGPALCVLVGAGLFFLSDVFVAREKFIERDVSNKLWGLPLYFAAQLLLAWSI